MKIRKDIKLIMRVARNIKNHRQRLGFSQQQLENVSNIKISRCESGNRDMTLTTISILSKHLQLEPYQLLK